MENNENQEEIRQEETVGKAPEAEEMTEAVEETQETQEAEEISKEAMLQEELKDMTDKFQRLQAEFANFKRRTNKEKEELRDVVTQELLTDLLPFLDNFERAMMAENKDLESFHKGMEMIFTQFGEILKNNGLEPVEAKGKKFDPNFHQAVQRVQNEELEDDTVAMELQKGYIVKGRVIRPSMVQVVAN